MIAVFLLEADGWLDALLPATVEKEALLGRKGEIAFFPLAVFQNAEILEKLANVFGLRARNGHVVGGPGIGSYFVFAPARVAAGLLIHFEQDEIGEPALAKSPGSAEAGDSTADDDNGNFFNMFCSGDRGAVAEEMAHLEGVVDEPAFDLFLTFERKTYKSRAAKTEKLAATQLQ